MAINVYSDLNRKFKSDGKDIINYDVYAINQSIGNILTYSPGDKWMSTDFGSYLSNYLMDPISDETADNLLTAVLYAINRWEPRVQVNLTESSVTPNYDNNMYQVLIVYNVISTKQSGEFRSALKLVTNND